MYGSEYYSIYVSVYIFSIHIKYNMYDYNLRVYVCT